MPTIKDVAREVGVSTATVSHVINKTRFVSDELTRKVLEAIREGPVAVPVGCDRDVRVMRQRRIEEHRSGQGNPLMKAVTLAGIPWNVVRTWHDADRMLEVQIKSRHNAWKLCPICNPQSWQHNANH